MNGDSGGPRVPKTLWLNILLWIPITFCLVIMLIHLALLAGGGRGDDSINLPITGAVFLACIITRMVIDLQFYQATCQRAIAKQAAAQTAALHDIRKALVALAAATAVIQPKQEAAPSATPEPAKTPFDVQQEIETKRRKDEAEKQAKAEELAVAQRERERKEAERRAMRFEPGALDGQAAARIAKEDADRFRGG